MPEEVGGEAGRHARRANRLGYGASSALHESPNGGL